MTQPAMPWRAECYECEQEAGITRPVGPMSMILMKDEQDAEVAKAYYLPHPRSPVDPRPCTGANTVVPKSKMRTAYTTTPGEDPPTLDPQGIRQ